MSTPTAVPTGVFVARQAVFDAALNVCGYELLFRNNRENEAGFIDHDMATAQVIINTFLDIGLEYVVGEHKAFLNLNTSFLPQGLWQELPPGRVILEIVGDLKDDGPLEGVFKEIKSAGFEICLDDYLSIPDPERYLKFATYAKIDVLGTDEQVLAGLFKTARKHRVKVIAKKVETRDQFQTCRSLGFDLFQGFFFSSPSNIAGSEMPPNRAALIRLVTELQSPDLGLDEIEEAVQQDLALAYKLLRFVNSPMCGCRVEVESIKQAAVLVGLHRIKTWATLILLSGIEDKPQELLEVALIRGKMCELIAAAQGERRTDTFYLIGLMSAISAILDIPPAKALDELPLSPEITEAILHHRGRGGEILGCVLAYERSEWKKVQCDRVEPDVIAQAYLESTRWSREVFSNVEQP